MKKTLFISDLDGTLLDGCSRVSAKTADMLNSLIDCGVLFSVATARTPATVVPLLGSVNMRIPAVVMTGASLWDWRSSTYLTPRLMGREEAATAVRICREGGVNPFDYVLPSGAAPLQVYHNGARTDGERQFVEERVNMPLKQFHLDTPEGASGALPRTILLFAMGPKDRVFEVADRIRSATACSVSAYVDIFGQDTGILEVFAPQVSKAAAVVELAHRVGAHRIVSFGDNLNDLPLAEVSDEFYAVANALPEVKEAATDVIGYNTAEAVPRQIARLCGLPAFTS